MFGLGGWEIAVLALAALVFFGPHKLPQLMKQAGKIMREVRKASYEFQNSLEREMEDDPYRKAHRREKKRKEKAAELGVPAEELTGDAPKPAPAVAAAPSASGREAANGNGSANGNGAEAKPGSEAGTLGGEPAPDAASSEKPKTGTG